MVIMELSRRQNIDMLKLRAKERYSVKEAAPTGWRGNANAAGNSLAARMENRQQDVETVAVTSATHTSNASNITNVQNNENDAAGEPTTGLDHD